MTMAENKAADRLRQWFYSNTLGEIRASALEATLDEALRFAAQEYPAVERTPVEQGTLAIRTMLPEGAEVHVSGQTSVRELRVAYSPHIAFALSAMFEKLADAIRRGPK